MAGGCNQATAKNSNRNGRERASPSTTTADHSPDNAAPPSPATPKKPPSISCTRLTRRISRARNNRIKTEVKLVSGVLGRNASTRVKRAMIRYSPPENRSWPMILSLGVMGQ